MKKHEIKTDNELLGFLIKIKNDNNDCDITDVFKGFGSDRDEDLMAMFNEMQDQGLINVKDFSTVHINPKGINSYVSPAKRVWSGIKQPLSYVFTYIMGILSAVIAQLIVFSITGK